MDSNIDSQITFKVLFVGNIQVGKTNLLYRFVKGKLPINSVPTIGVEFSTLTVTLKDGKDVKIQFWDTAGQERYRAIAQAHYRKSNGAIIVFDLTKESTFESVENYIQNIQKEAMQDVAIMLLGNKVDKIKENEELRKISKDEIQKFAHQHKILYEEVSAIENINVQESITKLAEEIYAIYTQNIQQL